MNLDNLEEKAPAADTEVSQDNEAVEKAVENGEVGLAPLLTLRSPHIAYKVESALKLGYVFQSGLFASTDKKCVLLMELGDDACPLKEHQTIQLAYGSDHDVQLANMIVENEGELLMTTADSVGYLYSLVIVNK